MEKQTCIHYTHRYASWFHPKIRVCILHGSKWMKWLFVSRNMTLHESVFVFFFFRFFFFSIWKVRLLLCKRVKFWHHNQVGSSSISTCTRCSVFVMLMQSLCSQNQRQGKTLKLLMIWKTENSEHFYYNTCRLKYIQPMKTYLIMLNTNAKRNPIICGAQKHAHRKRLSLHISSNIDSLWHVKYELKP